MVEGKACEILSGPTLSVPAALDEAREWRLYRRF